MSTETWRGRALTRNRVWLSRAAVILVFGPIAYTYAFWDNSPPWLLAPLAVVAVVAYYSLLYALSTPSEIAGQRVIPGEKMHFLDDSRTISRRRRLIAIGVFATAFVGMATTSGVLLAKTVAELAGGLVGTGLAALLIYWAALRLLSEEK